MVHIEGVKMSQLVRWYRVGSYDERSKYDAVCTLVHISDSVVMIEGLCGKINRQFWIELRAKIKSLGYTETLINRHGEWKMSTIK